MKTHTPLVRALGVRKAPVEAIQFAKMEMRMDVAVRLFSAARIYSHSRLRRCD